MDVPDKLFVDKGMLHCGFVDKERFNVVYRDDKTKFPISSGAESAVYSK